MDSAYKDSEKRISPRIKVEFIVTYKVEKPIEVYMWVGKKEVDALILDLSEEGMAILTDRNIPAPSILSMEFTLINLYANEGKRVKTMRISGEVRYSILSKKNNYRLGISFMQIVKKDKDAIANFVKMAMAQ